MIFFHNFLNSSHCTYGFLRFQLMSPGSFDFSRQDTNLLPLVSSVSAEGCCSPIMLFGSEFTPSTALWSCAVPYLCSTSRWEHSGSSSVTGQNNREVRLISHSVEHFHEHKPVFFYFIGRWLCQNSAIFCMWCGCSFSLYSTVKLIFLVVSTSTV
jgi:hypothetical protein